MTTVFLTYLSLLTSDSRISYLCVSAHKRQPYFLPICLCSQTTAVFLTYVSLLTNDNSISPICLYSQMTAVFLTYVSLLSNDSRISYLFVSAHQWQPYFLPMCLCSQMTAVFLTYLSLLTNDSRISYLFVSVHKWQPHFLPICLCSQLRVIFLTYLSLAMEDWSDSDLFVSGNILPNYIFKNLVANNGTLFRYLLILSYVGMTTFYDTYVHGFAWLVSAWCKLEAWFLQWSRTDENCVRVKISRGIVPFSSNGNRQCGH